MGIQRDWGRRFKRWSSPQPQCEHLNRDNYTEYVCDSDERNSHNWCSYELFRRFRPLEWRNIHHNDSRRGVSIYSKLSRPRDDESNSHPKNYSNKKRNRHNKYVYPVIATGLILNSLLPIKALAEGVGGVSATANPIANSSGSVTNQAIQVLQGPYVTNTYGGGVSCQGTTFNLTPYLQFADSRKDPWVDFYNEPQYNLTDVEGKTVKQTVTVKNYPWESWYDTRTKDDGTRWFEDGDSIEIEIDVDAPDGVPDVLNGGTTMEPTWMKPVRTDMSANQSFNAGLSATLSIPLNRGMQKKCSEAATAQISAVNQATANKRLDFELARLKNCGEMKKAGIFFHPASPYHAVCADVVVTAPGGQVMPHQHQLPQPQWTAPTSPSTDGQPLQQHSLPSVSGSSLEGTTQGVSSLGLSLSPSQSLSSQEVSPPSGSNPLGVLQVGQMSSQQQQSQP